jgi:hypothetical protein
MSPTCGNVMPPPACRAGCGVDSLTQRKQSGGDAEGAGLLCGVEFLTQSSKERRGRKGRGAGFSTGLTGWAGFRAGLGAARDHGKRFDQ